MAEIPDQKKKARILNELGEAFWRGGFDAMMTRAFQIEAGTIGPAFDFSDRKMWLSDMLRQIEREGKALSVKIELTPNQKSRLHMYRDDLRHGKFASVEDPTVKKVATRFAFKYDHKETKEGKIERLKKRIKDATGISGSKAEQIAEALVRGREVERLAVQKGWPIENGVITGDSGEISLADLKA